MPDVIAAAARTLDSNAALAQQASASPTFAKLKKDARRMTVDGKTLYVVEGDLLLDEVQLAEYALRADAGDDAAVAEAPVGGQKARLLGISKNGKLLRWKPGLVLTYCVAKETFTSDAEYKTVRESTRAATEAWMGVCGVEFEYRAALDTDPAGRAGKVIFPVMRYDAHGQFIAAAFFPDDPANRRFVVIDPSFFSPTLSFDRVGVLRHELGHVLGFRHEHIRSGAPAACPGEPLFGTTPLTDYDPRSVMHYFCGGVGSAELAITDVDRAGEQRLYGLPRSAFQFVE